MQEPRVLYSQPRDEVKGLSTGAALGQEIAGVEKSLSVVAKQVFVEEKK